VPHLRAKPRRAAESNVLSPLVPDNPRSSTIEMHGRKTVLGRRV